MAKSKIKSNGAPKKRRVITAFQGEIVRRKSEKTHSYYYIEKATGKRRSAAAWKHFNEFKKSTRDFGVTSMLETASESGGGELSFFIQSMDNVFREILFNNTGKKLYVLDRFSKEHKITQKNLYKFLLMQNKYRKDMIEMAQKNLPKGEKLTAFYHEVVGWQDDENENKFVFDYSFLIGLEDF